jgi:hypothetical protein
MAGFFQQFLQGAVNGFLDRPNLRDYQHASKTFTTNAYGNAPKFKYLFHVYFDINKDGVAGVLRDKIFPETTNYGVLVKTIDLPKFTFDLAELNQYNRKRYVQTKIKYEPVRISFHDDNANQIRRLWYNYYSYYYNDPNQPNTSQSFNEQLGSAANVLNIKNTYLPVLQPGQTDWGYTGEISNANLAATNNEGTNIKYSKVPFFKAIRIYGFNQHDFALYELINPIIDSFSHDSYNYGEANATMENNMTLRYETVKYYEGALNGQNPGSLVQGFGDAGIYDRTLSPIARPGSNRNVLGQGGLVESATGIFEDLSKGNLLRAAQTAGRLGRTFKNPQQILQAAQKEIVGGVTNAISNSNVTRSSVNIPAVGANTGTGMQQSSATNAPRTSAPVVSTPGNTQA